MVLVGKGQRPQSVPVGNLGTPSIFVEHRNDASDSPRIIRIPYMIDTHVHCRDEEQAYKTTIAKVYALAVARGIKIIFDMPNTKRPIISEERVKQRLGLAEGYGCLDGYFI